MIHSNTVDDTLAIELDEEQMLEEERIQLAFELVKY